MKKLKEYASLKFRSLIQHLKKWTQDSGQESLHQIRVDIKKIKAILSLVNQVKKKFKVHKQFKPLREIFRGAGAIRDQDVLTGMLLSYHIGRIEDVVIPGHKEKAISDFQFFRTKFIRNAKELKKNLNDDLKEIYKEDLESYLRKRQKFIKSKLWPELQIHSIHKTRKAIKEVIYLSEIGETLKKKELKFYDQLQDLIGKFHDDQILLALLNGNKNLKIDIRKTLETQYKTHKNEISLLVSNRYENHSGQ